MRSSDRGSFVLCPGAQAAGRAGLARFQLAAVRLAASGAKDAGTWTLDALSDVPAMRRELDAGQALVEVAESGDELALRHVLRADPGCTAPSWTVGCYRVGDLVPHSLRDFTDPVAAVQTLVDCGDEEHLAAELVSSTPEGLCWVALVRTGAQVRFQLLSDHSLLQRPGRHGLSDVEQAVVEAAQVRWAAVLASWYTSQGAAGSPLGARLASGTPGPLEVLGDMALHAPDTPAVLPALPWAVPPAGEWTSPPFAATATGALPGVMDMFFAITANLAELTDTVSGIAEMVDRLERSVGSLASHLDVAAPSRAAVLASAPSSRPVAGERDAPVPAGEPARPWWAIWHRAPRGAAAMGGAAATSL